MTNAEQIADALYPTTWKEPTKGFKIDTNAGRRGLAIEVAEHFLKIINQDETALHVMKAFYRREHRSEPLEDDVLKLTSYMSTALLAYELKLKDLGVME